MRSLVLSLPMLMVSGVCTAMTVVADFGGIPAAPFYAGISAEPADSHSASQMQPHPPVGPAGIEDMLPVPSQLTPGEVERKAVQLPMLPAPLFIVGDDNRSLAWIQRNQAALHQLQAVGWAVNVRDKAALGRIRAAAPGLGVIPMHIDDFAARVGLKHYPALITRTAVEQ